MAAAHPHATGVAVYPALFVIKLIWCTQKNVHNESVVKRIVIRFFNLFLYENSVALSMSQNVFLSDFLDIQIYTIFYAF